jgi:hypothetical protein
MTEKEIELLRFEKEFTSEDEGDDDYYYALDIVDGLTLITNCKSEEKGGQWQVEIFNTNPNIVFHQYGEVQSLLNLLESRIVKKK